MATNTADNLTSQRGKFEALVKDALEDNNIKPQDKVLLQNALYDKDAKSAEKAIETFNRAYPAKKITNFVSYDDIQEARENDAKALENLEITNEHDKANPAENILGGIMGAAGAAEAIAKSGSQILQEDDIYHKEYEKAVDNWYLSKAEYEKKHKNLDGYDENLYKGNYENDFKEKYKREHGYNASEDEVKQAVDANRIEYTEGTFDPDFKGETAHDIAYKRAMAKLENQKQKGNALERVIAERKLKSFERNTRRKYSNPDSDPNLKMLRGRAQRIGSAWAEHEMNFYQLGLKKDGNGKDYYDGDILNDRARHITNLKLQQLLGGYWGNQRDIYKDYPSGFAQKNSLYAKYLNDLLIQLGNFNGTAGGSSRSDLAANARNVARNLGSKAQIGAKEGLNRGAGALSNLAKNGLGMGKNLSNLAQQMGNFLNNLLQNALKFPGLNSILIVYGIMILVVVILIISAMIFMGGFGGGDSNSFQSSTPSSSQAELSCSTPLSSNDNLDSIKTKIKQFKFNLDQVKNMDLNTASEIYNIACIVASNTSTSTYLTQSSYSIFEIDAANNDPLYNCAGQYSGLGANNIEKNPKIIFFNLNLDNCGKLILDNDPKKNPVPDSTWSAFKKEEYKISEAMMEVIANQKYHTDDNLLINFYTIVVLKDNPIPGTACTQELKDKGNSTPGYDYPHTIQQCFADNLAIYLINSAVLDSLPLAGSGGQ